MSHDFESQEIKNLNPNEWLEESIKNGDIKYLNYKEFKNIQPVDTNRFGNVKRTNWKSLDKDFTLKPFNFNVDTFIKEVNI